MRKPVASDLEGGVIIGLRSFLRAETGELHRQLDELVGQIESRADYARFLQGTYRHRAPLELAWRSVDPQFQPVWRPRELLPLLSLDMADLAVAAAATEPAAVSNDTTSLLGTAYVLEGSALGARLLVKRAAALGFDGACGARYLSAQAASLESWRGLLADMERVERGEWDRAAAAAKAVFSHAVRAFATEELLTA